MLGRNKLSFPWILGRTSLVAVVLALSPSLQSFAQFQETAEAENTPLQSESSSILGDRASLESFLDGAMQVAMDEHHVAGATLAIVEGDRVLLTKGYGFADIAEAVPVDPETTLFRIGSVSKLLTWTAVMQLVESGQLDLNANVNDYLSSVKVPDAFNSPITLTHLLTHTPGFEDSVVGLFGRDETSLLPLDELLRKEMPKRILEPGVIASYSNHGTALAGLIVQEVSGIEWAAYIENRILDPLGMRHTTVRQPVPGELAAHLSKGYRRSRGESESMDFEFVPAAPAGSASASASDMARFMLAHLNGGAYDGGRILSAETTERMHARLFTHDERINGMAHGFMETSRNGLHIIGHGGDTFWFHSDLFLIPEHRLGVFVSFNTDTGAVARSAFLDAFFARYFPNPEVVPAPLPDHAERIHRFTGFYAFNRYDHTSLAKLGRLMSQINVSASPEGYLLTPDFAGGIARWVEVEPLLFREVDGPNSLAFREDGSGAITHAFISPMPPMALEPLQWYETLPAQGAFVLAVLGLFVASFVLPVVAAVVRRYYRRTLDEAIPLKAKLAIVFMLLLFLGFLAQFIAALSNPMDLGFGPTRALYAALGTGVAAAVMSVVVTVFALVLWFGGRGTAVARLYYTLVAAAAIALVFWMHHWNLLGVRL